MLSKKDKNIADVLGDAGYGLSQLSPDGSLSMASELVIVPSQLAYLQIPAAELRNFVDGIFPALAKNEIADSAMGFGHRYREGHDLLLDVPGTFANHGPFEGFKHAGHIIFTDFPTKAGIPIPGFSQTGLGHLLEQAGISSGWVQVSLFDSGVGILAIADGADTLTLALQGSLDMSCAVAFQTFGSGVLEVGLAMYTQNPLMLAGGIENILAGVISTWETFTVYVNPLDFIGEGATSALLGFGIAFGVAGESLGESTINAVRGGTVGALFSVSSAFGFGALAGFIAYRLGSALAETHNHSAQSQLSIDENSYRMLVEEICAGRIDIGELLLKAEPRWIGKDIDLLLGGKSKLLMCAENELPASGIQLNAQPRYLRGHPAILGNEVRVLATDPAQLTSIYQRAIKMASLRGCAHISKE